MPSTLLRRLVFILALLAGSTLLAQNPPETADISALRAKAEKGNSIAQYNLGLAYATGHDAAADLPEAYVWLSLAADNGTTGRALQNLLAQMTPAQLAEGKQRLARHHMPSPANATPAPANDPTDPVNADQKQLSHELALAWQEVDRLKASLAEARAARDNATSELAASSTELAALRVSSANLKNAQAGSDAAQIADLQQQLASTKTTATALASHSQELEDIAAQRGRALTESAAALAKAQARIAELEHAQPAQSDLSQKFTAAQAQISDLKQRLASATQPASDMEAEARLLQANSKRIEAEDKAKALSAELDRTRDQLTLAQATARNAQQGMDNMNGGLKSQIAGLQKQLDLQQAARTDAENHAKAIAAELATAQQALTEAKARPAAAVAAAPAPDPAELADTQAKLSTALRSYTVLQNENDKLKASADQLAAQVASLESRLADSQSSATSAQDTASSAKTQLTDLQARLASAQAAQTEAENRAQSLASDLATSRQNATNLSDQLTTTAASAAKADTLREQLRQTQDQLNAVQIQNGQLRTRLAIITAPPASTLAAPTRPTGPAPVAVNPPAPPALPAPAADSTATPPPTANPHEHTVVAGDTLSKIARDYYGTSLRWAEIYEANRNQLPNERALVVGMKLVIP